MNRDKPPVFKTPSGSGAMRFGRPSPTPSAVIGGGGGGADGVPTATGTGIATATKKRDVSAAELERDPHSILSKRPYNPHPASGVTVTPRFGSTSMLSSTPTQTQTPRTRLPPIPVPSSYTSAYLTPNAHTTTGTGTTTTSSSTNTTNTSATSTTTPKPRPKPLPNSSLERQIVSLTTQNSSLQTKLRQKEGVVRGLERDLRWFEEREEERERENKNGENSNGRENEHGAQTSPSSHLALTTLQNAHTTLLALSSSQTSQISGLSAQLDSLTKQMESLRRHLVEVEGERDEARREVDERRREVGELERVVEEGRMGSTSMGFGANWNGDENGNDSGIGNANANANANSTTANDLKILTNQLTTQTSHIRTLELSSVKMSRENEALRMQVRGLKRAKAELEVVKEEKRGLEVLVEGLREGWGVRDSNPNPNAMDTGMDMEYTTVVSSFAAAAAAPGPGPATTAALQELITLRAAHASLLDKHGSTTALLTERTSELAALQSLVVSSRDAIEASKSREEELRRCLDLERGEKGRERERVGLLEREVGFLKELVGSYEREREVDSAMGAGGGGKEDTERMRERLGQLERLLENYKDSNRGLVDEMAQLLGDGNGAAAVGDIDELRKAKWKGPKELFKDIAVLQAEKASLEADLAQSKDSIETYLSKIDSLEQTLFELGGEIAGGRHVPPNTRVLEMVDNPERRWFDGRKEVVEGLRRENGALMRRLEEVGKRVEEWEGLVGGKGGDAEGEGVNGVNREGGIKGTTTEDMVPRESWELVSKEKEELEEMVRQKEKRLLRLQQVFTQKSSEFRDAIASILGVKLAFYPNGSVRVTSVFDLNASFVFSPSKLDGTTQMQLIAQSEQGGPQDLPSMMNYWIETQQCIPGFLASVTLECWEGSKREA